MSWWTVYAAYIDAPLPVNEVIFLQDAKNLPPLTRQHSTLNHFNVLEQELFEYSKPLHTKKLFINVNKKGVCAIFESIHCKDDVHLLAKAMRWIQTQRLLWKLYEAFTVLVFSEMYNKLFYIWTAMFFLFNTKSLFCCKQRYSLLLLF